MKYYVGHPLQTRGAEQYTLNGGKGNGMRFLNVRNGLGLEVWISLDRCADPGRVTYKGMNMSYIAPCGNVAPAYFDKDGGFLTCFTAGFMTTVGFEGAGGASVDDGEAVPQHGSISCCPAELKAIEENDDEIKIKCTVRDGVLFGRRFVLERVYTISYKENVMNIRDTVTNEGEQEHPFLLLYHCNMGYPLVSENSIVKVPYSDIRATTKEAIENIDTALQMEKPQQGYVERCYFFDTVPAEGDTVKLGIFNPDISAGMVMSYDKEELPCFTEWKMMGRRDYVLGLEPGNCEPCPRAKMREKGVLRFLDADKSYSAGLTFKFIDEEEL